MKSFLKRYLGIDTLEINSQEILNNVKENSHNKTIERTLHMVRQEYTVMPRFGFHQPLDYNVDTYPANFDDAVLIPGQILPLPPAKERMGYPEDNEQYLSWGESDKILICKQIEKYMGHKENISILDFGCSSGRVLRHFYEESQKRNWKLFGVDVQARPIQWMRDNFPKDFCVYTGSTIPKLPFADNSMDVIYGFSIFTHIKYQWDMWLLELKRILKPGGLLIQTIHTENAWEFYYQNRHEEWIINSLSDAVLSAKNMPYKYFYQGDIGVSQVFWQKETAKQYWGRYIEVVDLFPPPDHRSFQDWIICQKQI